jgi:signal transduction histidine kinase
MDEVVIRKERVNLRKFLRQKQDEFYPQLSGADMALRLSLADGAATIDADSGLLARVFDNLLNNGIRYGREGRYIDIETEALPDKTRISFVTHANPVPAAELERIFDKLYRREKSRAAGLGGSGLGLAISRGIVEAHGGGERRELLYVNRCEICYPLPEGTVIQAGRPERGEGAAAGGGQWPERGAGDAVPKTRQPERGEGAAPGGEAEAV